MTKEEIKAILAEIDADSDKWDARWQEGYTAGKEAWSWFAFFVHGAMWLMLGCTAFGLFLFGSTTLHTTIVDEVRKERAQHLNYVCADGPGGTQYCAWQ